MAQKTKERLNESYENWMTQLPASVRQMKLSEIAIPGSHDSGTYKISMSSAAGADMEPEVRKLLKMFGCLAKRIIVRYAVTQGSLLDQLKAGARYFDLRLEYDADSSDFWIIHSLMSVRLKDVLMEFRQFLSLHPGEVILLDFNHFYAMNENHHATVVAMIRDYLGPLLYPPPSYSELTIPTLQQCLDVNQRVLVFYHHQIQGPFWNGGFIPSPVGDVQSVDRLLKFLSQNYGQRPNHCFYVTQGILTPDARYVSQHLFSSIRSIADSINPAIVDWLKDKKNGPEGINVCMVDFCERHEVIPAILKLNQVK